MVGNAPEPIVFTGCEAETCTHLRRSFVRDPLPLDSENRCSPLACRPRPLGGAHALEKTAPAKVEYTFGSLRTTPADAAKGQSSRMAQGRWHDRYACDLIQVLGRIPESSVLDKVLATFEIGSADARTILAQGRNAAQAAPKSVPTSIRRQETRWLLSRQSRARIRSSSLTNGRVYEDSLAALVEDLC